MIINKTTTQRDATEQKRLKALYNRRTPYFAWLPLRLHDGRTAWLRTVYRKLPINKHSREGYFILGETKYYSHSGLGF